MFTIPNLSVMDSTSVHQLAIELRGKLILAEERYSLAGPDEVEQAERDYLALEEVAMGLSKVIGYMNAEADKSLNGYNPAIQSEGRVNRPVGDKKITFIGQEKKKTIRQLWNDTPRPFPIKDEDYLKLINFISKSANWKIIFYPENPNYDYDIFAHFSLWDCSANEAMEKVLKVMEKKKKEIAEDKA